MIRLVPISRVECSRHSRAAGAWVMRGGFTRVDGVRVRSVFSISDWPCGKVAAVWTIWSTTVSSTRLMTSSWLERMFFAVSLGMPGDLFPGAMATMGGFEPKTLKKENGAALTMPFSSMVVIQAMGRGVTSEARML